MADKCSVYVNFIKADSLDYRLVENYDILFMQWNVTFNHARSQRWADGSLNVTYKQKWYSCSECICR